VTRLSSVIETLSVPKKASRAVTTAVLWQGGGGGVGVAVGIGCGDCLVGPPEPVVVFGVEAGDHGVAARDVRHCQHARGLDEVETAVGGETEQAVVPHPEVVVGPEERLLGLCGRPARTVDRA